MKTSTLRRKAPDSLAGRLAAFFKARPHVWIDGLILSRIAGQYAWRSRCSDLRRPPYRMDLRNRLRRVRVDDHTITISEYRFIPTEEKTVEGAAAGASTLTAAV
jgi:hypothetical protein